jgi:hypothetical protein
MLPKRISENIAAQAELQLIENPDSSEVISIIVQKNSTGGIEDPTGYIYNPNACIVIARPPDKGGLEFGEKAAQKGVPESNIFLIPQGQSLAAKVLLSKIKEIKKQLQVNNNNGTDDAIDLFGEDDKSDIALPFQTIAVRGLKGGVGTTSVAASLGLHLSDIGYKVAIIDLGTPPCMKYHCESPELKKEGSFLMGVANFCDLYVPTVPSWMVNSDKLSTQLEHIKKQYTCLIIDYSPQPHRNHIELIQPDINVLVMNSDIIQSVEPIRDVKSNKNVYVYNMSIPDITPEVIEQIIESEVITIKTDYAGCYAALAENLPAYTKSDVFATGIGLLAAQIKRSG